MLDLGDQVTPITVIANQQIIDGFDDACLLYGATAIGVIQTIPLFNRSSSVNFFRSDGLACGSVISSKSSNQSVSVAGMVEKIL